MRLIDKDSLLEQFKIKNTEELKFDGSIESICRVYFDKLADMFIEKAPEVDAKPVKHGKWVKDFTGIDWTYGPYICSECHERYGNSPVGYHMGKANYCPNCGVKMDLED